MITFCTFLWKGWAPRYSVQHVRAWARMMHATCSGDYRLVCFMQEPEPVEGIEVRQLWPLPAIRKIQRQNSFVRLRLFDPEINSGLGDVAVQMDLDVVVLQDMMPLFEGMGEFKAMRGWSAPLNGSMWALRPKTNAHVWSDLVKHPDAFLNVLKADIKKLAMVGSDQVWLSIKFPDAETWDQADGVYQFSKAAQYRKRADARAVFFAGMFKPWDGSTANRAPDLHETYMAAFRERAAA